MVFETINSEAGRADGSDFGSGLLAKSCKAAHLRAHELPFKYKNIISKPKKRLVGIEPASPPCKGGMAPRHLRPIYCTVGESNPLFSLTLTRYKTAYKESDSQMSFSSR